MVLKRRLKSMLSVASVVVACMGLCAPSALAAADGVDWRIEDMGVRGAWARGITGKGVTVAVIDSQVVADHPSLEGVDVEYRLAMKAGDSCWDEEDRSRVMRKPGDVTLSTSDGFYTTHATHMAGLIVGNGKGYDGGMGYQGIAPDAHAIAYPTSFTNKGDAGGLATNGACLNREGTAGGLDDAALADAVDSGARVVNMSFATLPDFDYAQVALHAIRHGVVLVRARDNDTSPGLYDLVGQPLLGQYFPGSVTVNSLARDGNIAKYSDVMDGNVSILSPGDGVPATKDVSTDSKEVVLSQGSNSSAAANLTGYLALVFQKWPDATGNQVLQSLIRNTRGNTSGEPELDPEHRRGFGIVDPSRLLEVDPTVYPDVNPLLEWAVKTSREHKETKGMYEHHDGWTETKGGVSDPFSPEGGKVECTSVCELVGREYERERVAWERVERCRGDGGSGCMRYSATATADEADREAGWDGVKAEYGRGGAAKSPSGSSSLPGWVVPVAVGSSVLLLSVVGGVALAGTLLGRRRRAGSVPVPAGPPTPDTLYADIARADVPHPHDPTTHNIASRIPPTTGAYPEQRPPLPPRR